MAVNLDAIDRIERLLCERYNVPSLPGALAAPVAAARAGDLEPLREALAGRELYRWRPDVDAALAQADAPEEQEADEPVRLEVVADNTADEEEEPATVAEPASVQEADEPEEQPEEQPKSSRHRK